MCVTSGNWQKQGEGNE